MLAEGIAEAVSSRGRCAIAVSGGRGPWRMFELLTEHDLEWVGVTIFQVDERVAPDGDPERNLTHLRESLPSAALDSIHPMPVTDDDLDAAGARYATELPASLDLVHLGLGPDGHTASLVPGDPVLGIDDRRVAVTGSYQGRQRMTLTYPALAAARRIVWLVTGEDKREALAKLRGADASIPAGRIARSAAQVIASADAVGG